MNRDMDLVRLILLEIEKEYHNSEVVNLSIEGYDFETIAYHCSILHEAGYISSYRASYAWGCDLVSFRVGGLTWSGHDYLDKVRDDSLWGKTKETIKNKGLPLIFYTIKTIANAFITAATEGVANSIIKNGGVVE